MGTISKTPTVTIQSNSLITEVNGVTGINIVYRDAGEIYESYVWQGVRQYDDSSYIFVGTGISKENGIGIGLVKIGNYSFSKSVSKNIGVKCLNNKGGTGPPVTTSLFGVNVISKNSFNLVGSYNNINPSTITLNSSTKIYGFYYTGSLTSDLLVPSNYKTILTDFNITFAHSMSNNLVVLNAGNLQKSSIKTFVFDTLNEALIPLSIPNYKTATSYGILYNGQNTSGDDIYTIVGGCSKSSKTVAQVYNLKSGIEGPYQPEPYGDAFILTFNLKTQKIEHYKVIPGSTSGTTLLHFEGISFYLKEKNVYTVAADVLNFKGVVDTAIDVVATKRKTTPIVKGSVRVIKYKNGNFTQLSNISLSGNSSQNYTTNSVSNNIACGIYKDSGDNITSPSIPYQASIN